jgi:hypothetical protein
MTRQLRPFAPVHWICERLVPGAYHWQGVYDAVKFKLSDECARARLTAAFDSPSHIVGGTSFRTPSVSGLLVLVPVTPTVRLAERVGAGGHPSAAGALWSLCRPLPVQDLKLEA